MNERVESLAVEEDMVCTNPAAIRVSRQKYSGRNVPFINEAFSSWPRPHYRPRIRAAHRVTWPQLHWLSPAMKTRASLFFEYLHPCLVPGGNRANSRPILTCGQHGRFDLRGQALTQMGFDASCNFPCEDDHLPTYPLHQVGPLSFVGLGQESEADWEAFSKPWLQELESYPRAELCSTRRRTPGF